MFMPSDDELIDSSKGDYKHKKYWGLKKRRKLDAAENSSRENWGLHYWDFEEAALFRNAHQTEKGLKLVQNRRTIPFSVTTCQASRNVVLYSIAGILKKQRRHCDIPLCVRPTVEEFKTIDNIKHSFLTIVETLAWDLAEQRRFDDNQNTGLADAINVHMAFYMEKRPIEGQAKEWEELARQNLWIKMHQWSDTRECLERPWLQ